MTDTVDEKNFTSNEKRPSEEEIEKETKIVRLDNVSPTSERTNEDTNENKELSESSNTENEEQSDTNQPSPQKEGESAILNIANAPPVPPPGMHLLSESQQQQIIQHYVQAQGHDLANFTASSLAQAMVAPIAVPNLASNLLQFQNGAVITALPGPPHPIPAPEESNKRQSTRNMSNDERRQRRLLRNRQAAKECRKKKKQHIHEMEEKIVHLEQQNALLLKEVEELKNKLNIAAMQGTEGYRLMKEVEELNAKLGMSSLPAQSNDPKESEEKLMDPEGPKQQETATSDNQKNTETDQVLS